jgi:5' nucleotidase, deoxy (Pyrimidine), cytosolic type C protein (NT5C)
MLVALDVDGVVADFLGPFLRFIENKTGCAPIAPETIVDLSYKDHPVITEAVLERCLAALADEPDFFTRLVPLLTPLEWRALDELSRARRLVFITHRQSSEGRDVRRLTSDWLARHGVSEPVVHCTADYKSKLVEDLGVGIFVDDRPENCLDVAEKTRAAVYMPRRNYNAFFAHPKVKTFDRFGELLEYLK